MSTSLPDGLIPYGPQTNCTLQLCPIEASVYGFRPSLAASYVFISLFALSMFIHAVQSVRYRTWIFLATMYCGCICEITGYIGRVMLHSNPFSFVGFLINIVCITIGPVFFAAAVYILLHRIVLLLGPHLSRLRPKAFYYIFIPCDLVSLILQALGGASSSTATTTTNSNIGVDISEAGLAFQVFTLLVFIGLCLDFGIRYYATPPHLKTVTTRRFQIFAAALAGAVFLIFIRCVYRIYELKNGYSGHLIREQGLFYAFESAMIAGATICTNIAHPGPVFYAEERARRELVKQMTREEKGEHGDWMG